MTIYLSVLVWREHIHSRLSPTVDWKASRLHRSSEDWRGGDGFLPRELRVGERTWEATKFAGRGPTGNCINCTGSPSSLPQAQRPSPPPGSLPPSHRKAGCTRNPAPLLFKLPPSSAPSPWTFAPTWRSPRHPRPPQSLAAASRILSPILSGSSSCVFFSL